MQTLKSWLVFAVALMSLVSLYGQQPEASLKKHPKEVVRYKVTLDGGDADKVTNVTIQVWSPGPIPASQPGFTNGFTVPCKKLETPRNTWECSMPIPENIANGTYTVNEVTINSGTFNKRYDEDFGVPSFILDNSSTFAAPKVTVKEQH